MSLLFEISQRFDISLRFDIPVDPDAPTARQLLQDELAKDDYHSTSNDWFARFLDWLAKLLSKKPNLPHGDGPGGIPAWVIAALIIAVVLAVATFLIVGPLRRSRRVKKPKAIFDDDTRDLDAIRDAAVEAAQRGDWSLATLERFRAIVRLGESKGLVAVIPGMTADEFARDAAQEVRALETDFEWAADTFDALRYAHAQSQESDYDRMTDIESAMTARSATKDAT